MAEYIPREAALNASKIVYIEYIEIDSDGYEDGNADEIPVVFKRDIEAIPAADVAPVRYGRWEKSYADHEAFGVRPFFRYCSECHEATVHQYNYCPNCGANMRDNTQKTSVDEEVKHG